MKHTALPTAHISVWAHDQGSSTLGLPASPKRTGDGPSLPQPATARAAPVRPDGPHAEGASTAVRALPSDPGIYPNAEPADAHRVRPGQPKPARLRPTLLVADSGRRYLRGEKLGQGGFGKVYLVVREDGDAFVAKFLRQESRQVFSHRINGQPLDKARSTFASSPWEINHERQLLCDVGQHVRLVDEGSGHGRHFFVLPMMTANMGALESFLGRRTSWVEWSGARKDLAVCALGGGAAHLTQAHAEGILHLDIKPENILVGEKGEVELADWGLAERLAAGERCVLSESGTAGFQAPEVSGEHMAQRASDIFSLAISACELGTGVQPLALYQEVHEGMDSSAAAAKFERWRTATLGAGAGQLPRLKDLRSRVKRNRWPLLRAHSTCTRELDRWAASMVSTFGASDATFLLRDMLAADPERRPTAAEVAQHFAGRHGNGTPEGDKVCALAGARQKVTEDPHVRVARLQNSWAELTSRAE